MSNKSFYTLRDVANWQEEKENVYDHSKIELPKVQRGFVWKISQIEDLWDSIIRKFPIGSFVFNINGSDQIQLLDGQQRATAITLGFENRTFRGSERFYRIFIDLEQPFNDARKFYIRVISDSHPWGYQRKSNNKPLEAEQKRESIKYLGEVDLINPDLDDCFPFDAGLPVPIHFFLDADMKGNTSDELFSMIHQWKLWSKVKSKLNSYVKANENRIDSDSEVYMLNSDSNYVRNRIALIYSKIKDALKHHKIPALYLENLLESDKSVNTNNENKTEKANDEDHEVENLFVRLNAGGTPLRGEELNYSILKSKIDKDTQRLIEEGCKYFINPARFITVVFRLFQNNNKSNTARDALGMNIKPKQFQSRLNTKEEISEFEVFLKKILESADYDNQNLINYTKSILEYIPEKNEFGFPHLISKKLVNSSAELLFVLWYRIINKKDRFTTILSTDVHSKMLGLMSLFLWLGKGENNRDHSKLLTNIWPAMKLLERDLFWSSATVQRAMIDGILSPIPSFKTTTAKNPGLKWFVKQNPNSKSALFNKYENLTDVAYNAEVILFTNDLVLYAQREFLYKIFHNKQFNLDDTNVPFDWDHIYPHKLIANKKGLPRLIKDFYNSIGNYRAWPYELNRMDSDDLPPIKFNPISNSEDVETLRNSWQRFIAKYPKLLSDINEIPEKLLKWSVCDDEWAESNVTDVKRSSKDVFNLIIKRAIKIAGQWYNNLKIDSLIPPTPKGKSSTIQNCFYINKFEINPKWLRKADWDLEGSVNIIFKKKIQIEKAELYVYLTFNKYKEDLLNEGDVYFGLYDKKSSGIVSKVKLPEDSKTEINKEQQYIQSSFTLVSENDQSLIALFGNILFWIESKNLPIKSIRNQVKDVLSDAFKKNYKSIFEIQS